LVFIFLLKKMGAHHSSDQQKQKEFEQQLANAPAKQANAKQIEAADDDDDDDEDNNVAKPGMEPKLSEPSEILPDLKSFTTFTNRIPK